jgi:ketosteroid isomerase-like protein
MSQENVKTVLDATAAFNRGDLDTWSKYWTDDIDHRAIEGAIDDRGPIQGKAGMRDYVQDWLDTFDDFRMEPVELIDAGEDKVVTVMRVVYDDGALPLPPCRATRTLSGDGLRSLPPAGR